MMDTVFGEPQWDFKIAAERQMYAYVTSRVTVNPVRGQPRVIDLEIPTAFFMVAPVLFNRDELKKASEKMPVEFYADQDGNRWIIGVSLGGFVPKDLWYYTKSNTPTWIDAALRTRR